MAFQAYSVSKGMRVGAAGGVTASLVTGLLSILGQRSQGQEEFFVTIARNMGLGDISVAGGWGLHLLTGFIAGAVFLGITAQVKQLRISNIRKGIAIGLLAGIAIWIVLLVPVTAVFFPEALSKTDIVVGTIIGHIIFGTVTASISVVLLRRSVQKQISA